MTDWIFQKLKLKFFLLYKSENIMLLYWFKHTSDAHRRFSFRIYYTFAKIVGVSYTQIAAEGCWQNGQKGPKKLVSTRIQTRGLPEREKSEKFLSKALPLSHGGITLDGDISKYKLISNLAKCYYL